MMTTTDHEPTLTALDALTTLHWGRGSGIGEQGLRSKQPPRTLRPAPNPRPLTPERVGVLEQVGPDERLDLAVFTDGSGSVAVVPEALPRTPSPVTLDTPSDLAAWVDGLRLPDGAHRMQEAA